MHAMGRFVLAIATVVLAAALPGCDLREGGLVFFPGDGYEAEIVATSDAGFAAPDGVVWSAGKFYLADESGHQVLIYDGVRVVRLADASNGLRSPEDLVVADDGVVFFTDDNAGGLWRIDPQGGIQQIATPEQGLPSTEGLTIAPNGNLLVGDGKTHAVYEVTRGGMVSRLFGSEDGLEKPEAMAFDEDGNLYIADNRQNVVFIRDRDGRVAKLFTAADGIAHPESLCYSNGSLYVTDDEAGKLYRYRKSDGLVTLAVFAGRLRNVQGVAVSDDGSVLVTVQDLKRGRGVLLRIRRI